MSLRALVPSCKVVLERLDAELTTGTMQGKVAAVAVVGNEDGAHHVTAAGTLTLAANAAHLARLLESSPCS